MPYFLSRTYFYGLLISAYKNPGGNDLDMIEKSIDFGVQKNFNQGLWGFTGRHNRNFHDLYHAYRFSMKSYRFWRSGGFDQNNNTIDISIISLRHFYRSRLTLGVSESRSGGYFTLWCPLFIILYTFFFFLLCRFYFL